MLGIRGFSPVPARGSASGVRLGQRAKDSWPVSQSSALGRDSGPMPPNERLALACRITGRQPLFYSSLARTLNMNFGGDLVVQLGRNLK